MRKRIYIALLLVTLPWGMRYIQQNYTRLASPSRPIDASALEETDTPSLPQEFRHVTFRFVFMRHGRSVANENQAKKKWLSTHALMLDSPLSAQGKHECIEVAGMVKEEFDLIFSSPLLRALHTATLVFPGTKVIVAVGLGESGMGMDNRASSVKKQKKYLGPLADCIDYQYVGYEKYMAYRSRRLVNKANMKTFFLLLEKLIKEGKIPLAKLSEEGKRTVPILVVTHSHAMVMELATKKIAKPYNLGMYEVLFSYDVAKGHFTRKSPPIASFHDKSSHCMLFEGYL